MNTEIRTRTYHHKLDFKDYVTTITYQAVHPSFTQLQPVSLLILAEARHFVNESVFIISKDRPKKCRTIVKHGSSLCFVPSRSVLGSLVMYCASGGFIFRFSFLGPATSDPLQCGILHRQTQSAKGPHAICRPTALTPHYHNSYSDSCHTSSINITSSHRICSLSLCLTSSDSYLLNLTESA